MLDVVTAYLHGPLETPLYLKSPPSFREVPFPPPRPGYFSGLRLHKALYGLKQASRLWYQHLRDFLLDQDFTNDATLPCVFAHKKGAEFVILAVYVDDINLIGTDSACKYTITRLESRFDIKLLGRTSLCLALQISHLPDGAVLLHQTAYTRRLLKRFGMHHANSLAAPMIGRSRTFQDPYTSASEEEEEVDKQGYLAAVGALLYLATFTTPDISFAVSTLGRHSQKPTVRHWAGVKHLFRYLRGTEDLGLLYSRNGTSEFVGYADAGYKSDPKSGKSQTGYIFLKNGAPVSWKSVKQTVTATSTNHAELIAFHEATRELVWLRTVECLITSQAGLEVAKEPIIINEDNSACVAQVAAGFIKADRVKHIDPQIFSFTQDLIQNKELQVNKIDSAKNIADMLTKALPAYTHKTHVHAASMRSYSKLKH